MYATLGVGGQIEFYHGIPSLQTLQNLVGGTVECIGIDDEGTTVIWLNDEGRLLRLPDNRYADMLAADALERGEWIAGNVVLTGGPDRHGETTTLSRRAIAQLKRARW